VLKGGGGVLLLLQAKCPHCMTSCDTKMFRISVIVEPKGPQSMHQAVWRPLDRCALLTSSIWYPSSTMPDRPDWAWCSRNNCVGRGGVPLAYLAVLFKED